MKKKSVQCPTGMLHSWFFPILDEPEKSHPKYGPKVEMGHGVKGYLSLTTVSGEIPGDNEIQYEEEHFATGQLDVETTMSDLEVNAQLYGHQYSQEDGELSSEHDDPAVGGYAMIEPILVKGEGEKFRATCLYRTKVIASSEKQEADTRKRGEFSAKMNAVSLKITRDKLKAWRHRKEFASEEEAVAWIGTIFPDSSAAAAADHK